MVRQSIRGQPDRHHRHVIKRRLDRLMDSCHRCRTIQAAFARGDIAGGRGSNPDPMLKRADLEVPTGVFRPYLPGLSIA